MVSPNIVVPKVNPEELHLDDQDFVEAVALLCTLAHAQVTMPAHCTIEEYKQLVALMEPLRVQCIMRSLTEHEKAVVRHTNPGLIPPDMLTFRAVR